MPAIPSRDGSSGPRQRPAHPHRYTTGAGRRDGTGTGAVVSLAVPVRELPSPTIEPVPQAPLTIVLRPRRDCWVSLRIDGESVVRRVMRAGEQETYGGRAEIILNVGDAGAFAFAINQRAGRALGASGQVVTVRLTPQNYADYVEP